ncbi:MAG: tRNA (adenosine(37)-N6)-threonylcarbamoyltransferase complex ATPase subunit type 1 TsaE, partial [Candidatus Adiutrix sp.]|nr:tRNA (adenosine(37)-N6)-threonylcarbamoyltransferase complex ATPase subunit type 1 TsaE [Candidatus Adiutrix sp.]
MTFKESLFSEAEIFLPDAAATAAAGRGLGLRLAEAARCGGLPSSFIITLSGGLGAGKTTFCQGLGLGLETEEPAAIVSPTFTLANEYPGLVDIFHLDLYRLESPREFSEAGLEDYLARPGLTVVEWPEKMSPGFWPADRLAL